MKMIHTLDWEKGRRKAQSPAGPVRHACMHQEPGRTDSKSLDNGDSPILPGPSSLNLTSSFPSCRVLSGTTTRRFSPRDPANALVPGLLKKTLLFPAPHGMVRSPGSKRSLSILQSLAIPVDRYPTPFPLPLFDYFRGIPTRPE